MTSVGAIPSALAVISHMPRAFSTPSALQVFAMPLLHTTARALPSAKFCFVTVTGAPHTKFCV